MSDERRERELEQLLEKAPPAPARPEYRANLRQRFLFGAAAAPQDDVFRDERPRAATRAPSHGRKTWLALAAAACIALILWFTKPVPRYWQVLPGTSAKVVRVNGTSLPMAEMELIAGALNDAQSVAAEGGTLRLMYRDQYAFELPAGARIDFATFGTTGGVDPYTLAAKGAALRVVTGPGFAGHTLRVQSGGANLLVTGTAFAIDDCPDGICVCGLEGRIGVMSKGAQDMALEPGKQCWFPKDGSATTWGAAHDAHLAPVRELEDAAKTSWRP